MNIHSLSRPVWRSWEGWLVIAASIWLLIVLSGCGGAPQPSPTPAPTTTTTTTPVTTLPDADALGYKAVIERIDAGKDEPFTVAHSYSFALVFYKNNTRVPYGTYPEKFSGLGWTDTGTLKLLADVHPWRRFGTVGSKGAFKLTASARIIGSSTELVATFNGVAQ